jgi:phage FluMu gp28-like protein
VNILVPRSPSERAAWEEKIRASRFLGYQGRWNGDNSRLKIMEKCRQAGVSWCDSLDSLMETAKKDWPFDCWISSRDQIQAQLYGQDVYEWARKVAVAAGALGESIIETTGGKQLSALRLPLANGRSIWSLSSNVDAQAGKRGTRKMDEFALNPANRQLYAIGKPGIQWGGRMCLFSTHRGTHNFFNTLITEIRHKGNPKKFSLHRVTIEDAVRDGLLVKLKQNWEKLDPEDPRLQMGEEEWLQTQREECPDEETWQQEYMCNPADDDSAFLSYDLIATCLYPATEDWQTDLRAAKNPLYVGVDIGRDHDLTVIWVIEKMGGVAFTRRVIICDRETFDAQETKLYEVLALPQTRRCCIDQTGMGRQFAERAIKRFGEYRVEGLHFTGPVKEELAYPVRAAFEDRSVRIPDDKFITADLRGIRKETTAGGNIRFAADRGKNGHSDRFWALALALHAGKNVQDAGEFVAWESPSGSRQRGKQERSGIGV